MRNATLWIAALILLASNANCARQGKDRQLGDQLPSEIVGNWTCIPQALDPTRPGYTSTLEILDDGTFTKEQHDDRSSFEYFGSVTYAGDSSLEFHVQQVVETRMPGLRRSVLGLRPVENITRTDVDEVFLCEFSMTDKKTLEIDVLGRPPFEQGIGLVFETYQRE